jgi:hypothetical protein
MVRRQVYLAPEQDALLRRRAQELGVSESAVIRMSIEQAQASATPRNDDAWQEELAFIRKRAAIPETGEKRRWTRDELYGRHPRRRKEMPCPSRGTRPSFGGSMPNS